MKLYTFTIHDADRDVPLFSCVAQSEKHAIAKCRAIGYKDFTLTETEEINVAEIDARIRTSIIANPFVGINWLPFIDAASILMESRAVDRREATWSFDVYRLTEDGKAERPFFVQGLVEMDGSMHLEMSGDVDREPRFTDEQIAQLEFMGWAKMDDLNIYFIEFEPGWVPLYVGERMVEALVSVHGVDENHFFGFTNNERLNDEIRALTTLVEVTIRHQSGTSDWFSLPKSAAITWANRVRAEIAERESKALEVELTTAETEDISSTISNPETEGTSGPVTIDELRHVPIVDEWFDDDEWNEYTVYAPAFRWSDGKVVLEVLPKIFLPFRGNKVPDVEDFFYHPQPWLHIDAEQFRKIPLRKKFHAGFELRRFLHDFARSVYETDGAPVPSPLDLDDVGQHAQIVARGIYGASFHENGEYLIDRANSIRWLVDDIEHDFGKRDEDNESDTFAPQALLSLVPEWGTRCYYRPISGQDLDGWGVHEFVVHSLLTLWPTRTQKRSTDAVNHEYLTNRLDAGYRAIRLGEQIHQWADFGFSTLHENHLAPVPDAEVPHNWMNFDSDRPPFASFFPRLRAVTREASRILGASESDAAMWLKERALRTGNSSTASEYSRPRIVKRPSDGFVKSVRQSVRKALNSKTPDPVTVAELPYTHRIAISIIAKVLQLTGGPKVHESWEELPPPIKKQFDNVFENNFDDEADLDLNDLPPNYAGWMADRVVATLHLMSRGYRVGQISAMWTGQHFQSPEGQKRIDELCFAMLFVDVVAWGVWKDADPRFEDAYVARQEGRFKDLISFVLFPPGWNVEIVYSPSGSTSGHDKVHITPDTIHGILDTSMLYLSDISLHFGKNWRLDVSGDFDRVNVSILAQVEGEDEAAFLTSQLRGLNLGPVRAREFNSRYWLNERNYEVSCSYSIPKRELLSINHAFNHATRLGNWIRHVVWEEEILGRIETTSAESRARIAQWPDFR